MKFNCLLDQRANLRPRLTCTDHSRQVGNISRPTGTQLFVNNHIVHGLVHAFNLACLRTLLRVPGGRSSFGCHGQSDPSGFRRVFVLPVTSTRLFQKPAIPFQQFDDIAYLHGENSYLGGCSCALPAMPGVTIPQRMVSIKVTLLISFKVVNPPRTLSSADSRRNRMPSSRAAFRISEVDFRSRIISRIRSVKSSSS